MCPLKTSPATIFILLYAPKMSTRLLDIFDQLWDGQSTAMFSKNKQMIWNEKSKNLAISGLAVQVEYLRVLKKVLFFLLALREIALYESVNIVIDFVSRDVMKGVRI